MDSSSSPGQSRSRQETQLAPNVAAGKQAEVGIAGPIWHDKPR
jgi:hypothetical protein